MAEKGKDKATDQAQTFRDAEESLKSLHEEYKKLTKEQNLPLVDVGNIDEANAAIKQYEGNILAVKKEQADLERGWGGIKEEIDGVIGELRKGYNPISNMTKAFTGMGKIITNLKHDQEGIDNLTKKQLQTAETNMAKLQSTAKLEADRLATSKGIGKSTVDEIQMMDKLTDKEKELLSARADDFEMFKKINKQLGIRIDQEKEYENALGLVGNSAKGVGKVLNKIGFGGLADQIGLSEAFEAASEEAKKISTEIGQAMNAQQRLLDIKEEEEELEKWLVDNARGRTKEVNAERRAKKAALKEIQGESKDINELYKDGFKTQTDSTDKTKVAQVYAKKLGENLAKSLGPMAMMVKFATSLWKSLVATDKMAGELAKQFGTSYSQGLKIQGAAAQTAIHHEDIMVSSEGIIKAQAEFNKLMGSNVKFTGEQAAEWATIQKRTGLTNEAMGALTVNSMLAGKSLKDQLAETHKVTMELNQQEGLSLSVKEIQEGISKASSAFALNMGMSTEKIAEAVGKAKALGLEVSDIEAISGNLLDFESSIASELEAELLTGRQLNLERARAAALAGDMATVAEEIKDQIGDAADFTKMNVIQQEALAKSLGMNKDQLAKTLIQEEKNAAIRAAGFDDMNEAQKEYNKLREGGMSAEEAGAKIGDESLAKQLESVSTQEKMEAIMTRIQEIFISISDTILSITEPLMNILVNILTPIFSVIGYIVEGLKLIGPLLAIVNAKMLIAKARAYGTAIMSAIGNIWKSVGGLPVVGPMLAIAATAGVVGFIMTQYNKKAKDAVISPEGGLLVSGPKGSISLDKEDSLIAGTNLGGKGGGGDKIERSGRIEERREMREGRQEMKKTNNLLQKILLKSTTIEMDGNRVGTQLARSNPALQ